MPGRRNASLSPPALRPPTSAWQYATQIPPPSPFRVDGVLASDPYLSNNYPYYPVSAPPAIASFTTAHPLPTPETIINDPLPPAPVQNEWWRRDRDLVSPGSVGVPEMTDEAFDYQYWPSSFLEPHWLSSKSRGLEEKIEGLTKGKRESDDEVKRLKSAVSTVTSMHGKAKEEAERVQELLQASESEKADLSEDNASLRREVEALKAKVDDSEKEMERMRASVKSLESEKWEQVSIVIDGEKSKLAAEVKAKVSGLERGNSDLKKVNAGLNSRVEALIIEGERLREQLRSSEADKDKLATSTAAEILELLNSKVKKENATLRMKADGTRQEELQSKAGKTRTALEVLIDCTSMLKSTSRKLQGLPKVEDDETANDYNNEDGLELAMMNFEFRSELLGIEDLFKARTDKLEALEKELSLGDWYVVED